MAAAFSSFALRFGYGKVQSMHISVETWNAFAYSYVSGSRSIILQERPIELRSAFARSGGRYANPIDESRVEHGSRGVREGGKDESM